MAENETPDLNAQEQQAGNDLSPARHGWFSWWWIWIPVIVVVTLWIAGWGFGNYGGPWSKTPQRVQPRITDPVPGALLLSITAAFDGRISQG